VAKARERGPSGLLVVDKPAGMTSHDVVSKIRWIAGTRRVGHAGTLDPAATGVLVLGLNKATKLLTYLVGQDKTYEARLVLGVATLTEDAEGELTGIARAEAVRALTREKIENAVRSLTGDIMQVPSAVSAIKVKGVRSYARVRDGEDIELAARKITIHEAAIHEVRDSKLDTRLYTVAEGLDIPVCVPVVEVDITVSCSSGTYIRAFARDVGKALGVGGHLSALNRIRVGNVYQREAFDLAELMKERENADGPLDLPVLSLEEAARRLFNVRQLSTQEATDISFGRRITVTVSEEGSDALVLGTQSPESQHASTEGITAAFAPDGTLVALIENIKFRGSPCAAPVLVFEAGIDFSREAGERL